MMPLDMLAILGGGAVLPYVTEAAWEWLQAHCQHKRGARAPD